eukprot:34805-Amphidinium_carterae.1
MNRGIYEMNAWIDNDNGRETDVTEHVCGLEVTLDTASADGLEVDHPAGAEGSDYPAGAGDVGYP